MEGECEDFRQLWLRSHISRGQWEIVHLGSLHNMHVHTNTLTYTHVHVLTPFAYHSNKSAGGTRVNLDWLAAFGQVTLPSQRFSFLVHTMKQGRPSLQACGIDYIRNISEATTTPWSWQLETCWFPLTFTSVSQNIIACGFFIKKALLMTQVVEMIDHLTGGKGHRAS